MTKISGYALLRSAVDHHERGDLRNAEREYRKSIKTGYSHHAIFLNLGIICKNSGREEEAIHLYLKAIEVNPNHPGAYTNLGNLYNKLCNYEHAIFYSSKSLKLQPNNPEALITLGWSYKKLGKLDLALASTLKSLQLKPDNPVAINNIKAFIDKLHISPSNANNITRAYELLLNRTDTSHKKLSKIFLQQFLPTIQKVHRHIRLS